MNPQDASPADGSEATSGRRWGIARVPWLWPVRIRILFVTDGRITAGHYSDEFGLGPVLDTLRDPFFAWWVRFDVEFVDRDEGFRFTQEGFDIDAYDQVWFFGDWPGLDANDRTVGDEVIELPEYAPLTEAELVVVAEWMERGGGVFAAGDHALLGASMCHRIPRVRSMRKWTRAQGVPSFAEGDRNETLQHVGSDAIGWEGDRFAQRIHPVWGRASSRPFDVYGRFPHPLLCGEDGPIERFPDHMHEGAVVEDDDVPLDVPLGIAGFDGVEYPDIPPVIAAGASVGPGTFDLRPRPHVIAHAWTTHRWSSDYPPKLLRPREFAVVGVYDGDPARVGRVVVDSTWHHWFSMNLNGLQTGAPQVFRGMQSYYRNVALWLATPQQRRSMLFAATWGAIVGSQPGAFDQVMGIWDVGARVVDVIGRTAPQCIVSELVGAVFAEQVLPARAGRPDRVLQLRETVNHAIVGSIGLPLIELAHHHFKERARGRRTELDHGGVERRALAGAADGRRRLAATLADSVAEIDALRRVLLDERTAVSP